MSTFVKPRSDRPDLKSTSAERRSSGVICLMGTPWRSRGTKNQFRRSSELKGRLAFARLAESRALRKALAAFAIVGAGSGAGASGDTPPPRVSAPRVSRNLRIIA